MNELYCAIRDMMRKAQTNSDLYRYYPHIYIAASVLAGLLISFGSFASMTCGGLCVGVLGIATKLVTAFAFASALSFIVAAGGELFTGSNMVLGTATIGGHITFGRCFGMWVACWFGNLIGSWIGVLLFHYSGADAIHSYSHFIASVAHAKVGLSESAMLFRGVLCNALVCLSVWCAFRLKGDAAKLIMVFWGIFVFMVCGFEHSIANMSIIGSAMMCGADVTVMEYFNSLSIVTAGNVIGGLMIGVFFYYIERGYSRLW